MGMEISPCCHTLCNSYVSSRCAYGATSDVDYAMSCHNGGLPTLRHNEVRDITAEMVKEVCTNVEIEPRLLPLDGENLQLRTANREDEARLNLRATGFWSRGQEAFFDVRFFTLAPPHRNKELVTLYRAHEAVKKREYGERVREVERGVFSHPQVGWRTNVPPSSKDWLTS